MKRLANWLTRQTNLPLDLLAFVTFGAPLMILLSQTMLGGPKQGIIDYWDGNMVYAFATPYAIYYTMLLTLIVVVNIAFRFRK